MQAFACMPRLEVVRILALVKLKESLILKESRSLSLNLCDLFLLCIYFIKLHNAFVFATHKYFVFLSCFVSFISVHFGLSQVTNLRPVDSQKILGRSKRNLLI